MAAVNYRCSCSCSCSCSSCYCCITNHRTNFFFKIGRTCSSVRRTITNTNITTQRIQSVQRTSWWRIQFVVLQLVIITITTKFNNNNNNNNNIWCNCFVSSSISLLNSHNSMNNSMILRKFISQTPQSSSQQMIRKILVSASTLSTLKPSRTSLFLYHGSGHKVLQHEARSSFTTTSSSSSSSSKGNSGTSHTKRKDSWRKQIHVSDDVPVSLSGSSLSSKMKENSINNLKLQFHDTPLGKNGMHLLDGLDHYTVYATDDGHPLSVYGIQSEHLNALNDNDIKENSTASKTRKPILLLHGRTWSSVPVYHLLGGPFTKLQESQESRSLMEALLAKGLQPYCMDFRGFGGTHMDATQAVEPYRCVQDAETVLQWIQQRHTITTHTDEDTNHHENNNNNNSHNLCNDETAIPALLGWSQGALVAQLVAQRNFHQHPTTTMPSTTSLSVAAKPLLSKLILYGSIYDPLVRYPREPLYVSSNHSSSSKNKESTSRQQQLNTYDAAIEDFTVEGTIPPEPARLFAEAALLSDPVKVIWKNLYQFNNCDPARVHVPCLVIAGDQDPYAPLHVQQELFCNLARASDRTWSILSGSDHACHLLDGRDRLINTVVSFVMNGKRTEPRF